MGLNIYVADTKNEQQLRLKTFQGLSAGEARGFLYDLYARDVKKKDYRAVIKTLGHKLELSTEQAVAASSPQHENTASVQVLDEEKLKARVESIIYDETSIHELLTTVWNFSDKTAIIIRA